MTTYKIEELEKGLDEIKARIEKDRDALQEYMDNEYDRKKDDEATEEVF